MRNNGGFTLLELVVIMALMSVVLIFTVPRVIRFARGADDNRVIFIKSIDRVFRDSVTNSRLNLIVIHSKTKGEQISGIPDKRNGISVMTLKDGVLVESGSKLLSYVQFPDSFSVESVCAGKGTVLKTGDIIIPVYPDGKTETAVITVNNGGKYESFRLRTGGLIDADGSETAYENAYYSK